MTRFDTQLAHLGRDSARDARTVNPPLTRASTILYDSLEQLRQVRADVPYEGPRYGIYGTSTTFELQTAMAQLCRTESCLATGSGLTAIAATMSAHATPGSRVLVQGDVYQPARDFAERELADRVDLRFFATVDELDALATDDTSLVFIEVPTSGTMRMIDIEAVVAVAHDAGAPVACDSTWGTPRFFDAHALGIDISIHAATKYIGGHSDIMLGLTTGTYDALGAHARVVPALRLHGRPGRVLAGPARAAHPQRPPRAAPGQRPRGGGLARGPAAGRAGALPGPALGPRPRAVAASVQRRARPLLHRAARLRRGRPRSFIESLELFGLGASWGGFESLVLPAIPHARRGLDPQPDEGRLVRLHIGLEDPADLMADLQQALARL